MMQIQEKGPFQISLFIKNEDEKYFILKRNTTLYQNFKNCYCIIRKEIEFTQYPCYQNILHYKKTYKYGIVMGVGIFDKWVEKITGWDLLITQCYGKGVDNFPLQLHFVPYGFNPNLHYPIKQDILYDAIFIGRNQRKNRNPRKYISKIKDVKYIGYG